MSFAISAKEPMSRTVCGFISSCMGYLYLKFSVKGCFLNHRFVTFCRKPAETSIKWLLVTALLPSVHSSTIAKGLRALTATEQ